MSNAKSGAVEPATPPRADRLRFVGQWDIEMTLVILRESWVATPAEIRRYLRIERTLATDKERVCEVK